MSYFGEVEDFEIDDEFSAGGSFEPIPKGTVVKAMVVDIEWKDDFITDFSDKETKHRGVNIQWEVIDGEYKERKIFQKVHLGHPDSAKRQKAMKMLLAIDAFASGGKIKKAGKEPTDAVLQKHLISKPMYLKLAVWKSGDNAGNWVSSVSKRAPEVKEDEDDDIDF